ncbi:hypothetical protein N7509_007729 [Penicillium cosmopolitanum]|uniref:Uncharacterized protein n=1 Tax=Penicillium cosmopolitanum TaxID=1131564 RepID=A0A9X0B8M8_9EURO|nr:uncharacterized protein N7509_007729 [Penicillium cosmopolitanum]KAJ5392239.1 hypothetical protein N7509_007729 [Penicillium cosmopolitanum]
MAHRFGAPIWKRLRAETGRSVIWDDSYIRAALTLTKLINTEHTLTPKTLGRIPKIRHSSEYAVMIDIEVEYALKAYCAPKA